MKNMFLNIVGVVCVVAAIFFAINYTKEKKMNIGIEYENMDRTKNPGTDFYDYATLGWRNKNPLPNDYTRYGSFDVLSNKNLERVREIAETDNGKIGTLYNIAMNAEKLNADKTAPVKPYLDAVDAIKTRADLASYLGNAHRSVSPAFWHDSVELDAKDSNHYLYHISQGGTGLSRDYFFDNDSKTREIRKQYKEYMKKIMANFDIKVDIEKLYGLEERMAKSFYKKELLRDPHANYHKMSIVEVKEKFPGFDWDAYLTTRGATAAKFINIEQPSAITESVAIMNDTDLDLIKTYLKYCVVSSATSLLDDETYDIAFDFYNRKMSGQPEPKPRWKRAIGKLNATLGEEIGRLYVKKYFPASAKKRMQNLVENLQRAYEIRIKNLDWMSDETKHHALEKLHSFKAKIGYPDKWRDYSKLVIDEKDSLFDNMVRVSIFEDNFWLEKIGKEKDPSIWYMNAHEINAYYDPSTNEICFPAGILQPPFFDMDADDAFNYGGIGCVIGHEMTHGFDDMGRNFDKDGNLRDWWTPADADGFNKRANVMREFFDKIKISNDVNANGEFTLGENLADYGGVTIAYTAYKNFGTPSETVDGLTPDMRFFIAYGGVWAQNIRDAEALRLTKVDVHSLPRYRVNGILPHINAWYKAFEITDQDKLYLAPEQRTKLW
ncbi:MAG: M13 family metallopeptidase [Alphaproteobacteria bacterium]|nr:M13 family metallopeptidase [Alphaproteobacteria bacterium]